MKIAVFDPGESTGWVVYNTDTQAMVGGTCPRDHLTIAEILDEYTPDEVVFETFALYPGKAQSLAWNTFYPCEVIGVIRYLCMLNRIPYSNQAPSVKKYAGGFQADWKAILRHPGQAITEHTKDAYLHLKYFLLRGKQKARARH